MRSAGSTGALAAASCCMTCARKVTTARRSESFAKSVDLSVASVESLGEMSQAWASVTHCSAADLSSQVSNRSVGTHDGRSSPSSSSKPAACAISIHSAAVGASVFKSRAVAEKSRTARPPARKTLGGSTAQASRRSRTCAIASRAWTPACSSLLADWVFSAATEILGGGQVGATTSVRWSRTA